MTTLQRAPRFTLSAKATLLVGYWLLALVLFQVVSAPTPGYEVSIYGALSPVFWVVLSLVFLIALVLTLRPETATGVRRWGMFLGFLATLTILALPLLRGYYFIGAGDALTHLGWMKDIVAGRLDPFDFLYPGLHLLAVSLSHLSGLALERATLVSVFLFGTLFVVSIPLCLSRLSTPPWGPAIGLFSGALLLPINNVSAHYMAHPSTQAILFLPFVLYLTISYLQQPPVSEHRVTGLGVILGLSSMAVVLIHPQQALNVLIVFVTIVVTQVVFWWWRRNVGGVTQRSFRGQTLVLLLSFLYWAPQFNRTTDAATSIVNKLFTAAGEPAGDEVAQRGASLAQVGGSIEELFVKIFLVMVVYAVLAGIVGLVYVARRNADVDRSHSTVIQQLSVAVIPLTVMFAGYYLSSATTQHFRQIAFVMAVVTVLGAVAISDGTRLVRERVTSKGVHAALVVFLAVSIALAIPVVYASPYIFQASPQVSEQKIVGLNESFEAGADYPYAGIRSGPGRELDGMYGTNQNRTTAPSMPLNGGEIPPEVFRSLRFSEHANGPGYFYVSEKDYVREVKVYNGFRYPESSFEALDRQPSLSRLYTNGDLRTYYVHPEDREEAA